MYDHSKWVIDPLKTRPIVFAYPDGNVSPQITSWCAERFPVNQPSGLAYDAINMGDYARARNWLIANCCLPGCTAIPPEITDFVFIDSDIVPNTLSDAIFHVEADVVGCLHPQPSATAWLYPDQFHSGFWRSSRTALGRMKGPWFKFIRSKDHSEILACDCEYFRRKAKKCGLTIAHAGFAEHGNTQTWCR